MARPDKAAAVAELAEEFRSSHGVVLTEYRGLTVKQLQELRRALGGNASYTVVKNTLTKIAAKEAGVESFDALLSGPSAIAFIKGDVVETAKSLRDFAKVNSPLVIKGGILDGKPLTIAEIAKIADLESREVLLARLAGALLASLQNAAFLFNAPLVKVARLAGALQEKAEQDPSILAAGPGETAAADSTPAAQESEPVAEESEPVAQESEPAAEESEPAGEAPSGPDEPGSVDPEPAADPEPVAEPTPEG